LILLFLGMKFEVYDKRKSNDNFELTNISILRNIIHNIDILFGILTFITNDDFWKMAKIGKNWGFMVWHEN